MNGYWKKPAYHRGGDLICGPLQLNWYMGLRLHVTWPVAKTYVLRAPA